MDRKTLVQSYREVKRLQTHFTDWIQRFKSEVVCRNVQEIVVYAKYNSKTTFRFIVSRNL